MKHLFITFTLVSSLFVSAQEAPDPIRAEYFTCSLNAGKDMNDMMKWVEKWNRWMAERLSNVSNGIERT